jgi:hypothetical protein
MANTPYYTKAEVEAKIATIDLRVISAETTIGDLESALDTINGQIV